MTAALTLRFLHTDVFANASFFGNPLAVVICPNDLDLADASMQRVANWLNLSECTFVQSAADQLSYRVRIFTPKQELPFAGHPSIGSAAALLHEHLLDTSVKYFTQHCAAGALPVWCEDDVWFVQAPAAMKRTLGVHSRKQLESICELTLVQNCVPCVMDLGPRWAVAEFSSASELLAATPDYAALSQWNRDNENLGLAAFARGLDDLGVYLEVRCFVPLDGIPEDPVTGSGNAAIAAYLHSIAGFGTLPRNFRARQGRALGRDGHLQLQVSDAGVVAVGGRVRVIAKGEITIDVA